MKSLKKLVSLNLAVAALLVAGCGKAKIDGSGPGVVTPPINGGQGSNPLSPQEFANYCSSNFGFLYAIGNDLFCRFELNHGNATWTYRGGNSSVPQYLQVGSSVIWTGFPQSFLALNPFEKLTATADIQWGTSTSWTSCDYSYVGTVGIGTSSTLISLGGSNQPTSVQISAAGNYQIGLPSNPAMNCARIRLFDVKVERCQNQSKQAVACP
jgi:hypothetical protein